MYCLLSNKKSILSEEIFISLFIYTISVGSNQAKKNNDLSMNLIGYEIVFLILLERKDC